MKYSVLLESRAEKQLLSLSDSVIVHIHSRLASLKDNPRPAGAKKLKGRFKEGWRIRVRDYRVLYTIDDDNRIVSVFEIGKRGEIYRRKR